MKRFSGILVFVVVFLVAGVAMHLALYKKPGIFVWTYSATAESGKPGFSRTTVEWLSVAGAQPDATDGIDDPSSGGERGGEAPEEEILEVVPAPEPAADASGSPDEILLFNGEDLEGWVKTQFGGEGDVFVNEEGNLEFGFGAVMTGVHWEGEAPALTNYELTLDAMKLDGYDFFCALTFPVKDSHATLVVGGWGGGIVGISSVDDLNASENETMNIEGFEKDRWYEVRVRVTDEKLEAWLDERQMVDLALKDRKISLLPGDVELCVPIGVASYQTRAQYRNIRWRNLSGDE